MQGVCENKFPSSNAADVTAADIETMADNIGKVTLSSDNDNDELFNDPPPKEDCPICMLPLPYTSGMCGVNITYQPCCGKAICSGCIDEMLDGNMRKLCPFCREPHHKSNKELLKRYKKRMKLNCPEAFFSMGSGYRFGLYGLPKNFSKGLDLYIQCAKLGSPSAQCAIGNIYMLGVDSVAKDTKKAIHYFKLAAKQGDLWARNRLGIIEKEMGNIDIAMKHFIMAARTGCDHSLTEVGVGYKAGHVTKDEYASTLRTNILYMK